MSGKSIKKIGTLLTGDRPLPNNRDAEKAVLGCLLTDPDTISVAAVKIRFDGAFYSSSHQIIFNTVLEMSTSESKAAIDLITVSDKLSSTGKLAIIGGDSYLMELMNVIPTTANVERYVEIVHDYAILRRLIKASADIVDQCFDSQDTEVKLIVDKIQQEIMEVSNLQESDSAVHIGETMKGVIDHIIKLTDGSDEAKGLSTGFSDVDQLLTGLRPGEMFVLAARPSIGKTTFALNLAANIALRSRPGEHVPVAIFSLEMNTQSLVMRLLCSEAGIGMGEIQDSVLSHSRWNDLTQAAETLRKAPIYIDDTGQLDVIELRAKARRLKEQHDIQFIVIDYLQLMHGLGGKQSNREQDVAQMSGGIKSLAKELNLPILILAQLNRQAEQAGAGKPKLSHLRESGAIEQDADVVGILHRDRDAVIEGDRETIARDGVEAELIIAKHRNGEVGSVPLMFFPSTTTFKNFSRINEDDHY